MTGAFPLGNSTKTKNPGALSETGVCFDEIFRQDLIRPVARSRLMGVPYYSSLIPAALLICCTSRASIQGGRFC